jgi:adenylate kinase family enzyme
LIAIVGGSGAGKTTLARALAAQFDAVVVSQDWFLRPRPERPSPAFLDKYDFAAMEQALRRLLGGRTVQFAPFDQRTRARGGFITLEPRPVCIVEGVAALYSPLVRRRADVRIFLDAPATEREERQIRRLDEEGWYAGQDRGALRAAIQAKKTTEDPTIRRQAALGQRIVNTAALSVPEIVCREVDALRWLGVPRVTERAPAGGAGGTTPPAPYRDGASAAGGWPRGLAQQHRTEPYGNRAPIAA